MEDKKTPNWVATQYKTHRKESCTAQINVRIPPSEKAKLKHVENWQEEVRKLITQLTDQVPV